MLHSLVVLATATLLQTPTLSAFQSTPRPYAFRSKLSTNTISSLSTTSRYRAIKANENDEDSIPDELKLPESTLSQEEEDAIQWDLFLKHQAKGKWRGTWTSYDYMGDVIDSTIASVNLEYDDSTSQVQHTHEIAMGATTSNCDTCFDSTDIRTIPIGSYSKGNLSKYRCASIGMTCGPSLLRSGAMSTELVLTHGNGRVRVIYQHAPVWESNIEPGSCPPQGLKLFRTMVSRETLDTPGPPTRQSEQAEIPSRGNPLFFRPVPPFQWHKKWAGTSWTWGPQSGDRGWSISDLEEADAWHGRPTGDTGDVWTMRLPGGILLQCPRVITGGRSGLCRLAWLPEDDAAVGTEADGDTAKLLRIESAVSALEPVIDEENEVMVGFYPPSLSSLRCDTLVKVGELENTSMLEKLRNMGEMEEEKDGEIAPLDEDDLKDNNGQEDGTLSGDGDEDSGIDAIRNALKL